MIYIYIVALMLIIGIFTTLFVLQSKKHTKHKKKTLTVSTEETIEKQQISQPVIVTENLDESGKFEDFELDDEKTVNQNKGKTNPFFQQKFFFEKEDTEEEEEEFDFSKYDKMLEDERERMLDDDLDKDEEDDFFDFNNMKYDDFMPDDLKNILMDKSVANNDEEDK